MNQHLVVSGKGTVHYHSCYGKQMVMYLRMSTGEAEQIVMVGHCCPGSWKRWIRTWTQTQKSQNTLFTFYTTLIYLVYKHMCEGNTLQNAIDYRVSVVKLFRNLI